MKKSWGLVSAVLFVALVASQVCGAVYEVGPGKAYTSIGAVPWESITAGDTVKIYYRDTPYKEKFCTTPIGTLSQPVLIQGIAGPNGELPVLDGENATTRLELSYWNDERCIMKIGAGTVPAGPTGKYITVENLEFKSARPPFQYTCDEGTVKSYLSMASGIFVAYGENITVRNCVFRNCGNGFFVGSSDDIASKDILLEGCYLYDNGIPASTYEHHSYDAAIRHTYQYNYYGQIRDGCLGAGLKDRSALTVARYNWIEFNNDDGNREVEYVDGADSILIRNDSQYGNDFLYGNIIIEGMNGNRQIIHYGGDSGDTNLHRWGLLKCYNNTIVSIRTDRDTIFRLSNYNEVVDARNNIVYCPNNSTFEWTSDDSGGTLYLYNNWIRSGVTLSSGGATVVESGSVRTADPGFIDWNGRDFHLATGSACINAGTTLHADCGSYPVTMHYLKHQTYETRPSSGALDIGAYEYNGGAPANLVVFTNSLERGMTSVAYSQTLVAVGGLTPYSWSVVGGSLPSGLSLGSSTGIISGSPTSTGTSNFTVRVTDSQGTPDTDDQGLTIIVDPPLDLQITTTSLPTAYLSTAYSRTLAASGGVTPYSWSVVAGSLPAGLSLASSTGVISGTPTASGTSNFTVRVTDSQTPTQDTDDQALSIAVVQGQLFETTFEDGFNGYSGTADAWITPDDPDTNFGSGDSGHIQYATPDRQLLRFDLSSIPSNAQVHSANMSIYGYNLSLTPNAAAYRVLKHWEEMQATYNSRLTGTAWTNSGLSPLSDYEGGAPINSGNVTAIGWVNFSVTDLVTNWVSAASANEGVVMLLTTNGHIWTRLSEYDTLLLRPKLVVQYTAPQSGVEDLVLTTTGLAGGNVGISYSQMLSATGGVTPYAWSLASGSLPSGLSLASATGVISGTPTTAGNYNFTARVTDNQAPTHDTADKALSISIAAPGDLVITTTSLPNALKNANYSRSLSATGGLMPYSWSVISGSLPTGLSLGSGTGIISGTPTASGTSNFTVRVTDSQTPTPDTDDQALSIVVLDSQTYEVTFQDGVNGYTGTDDAWLDSDSPTTNYGAAVNGHLQYNTPDRQVHRFDLSSIPAGSVVNSATFSIYAYNITGATSATVNAYRVITHWAEMEVTYNNRLTSTAWGTPGLLSGTDYAASIAADSNATIAAWADFNVTSLVGQWVDGTYTNEGVVLMLATSAHVFNWLSDTTSSPTLRPKLVVNYTAPIGGVPDLLITTTSLPNGTVGTSYSQTVSATGGQTPYSWSVISGSLPAGLSLGSSSGTISGTPTASGTSNFTVRVTDSQGTPDTDDQALSIVISASIPDLLITTTSLPGGTLGVAYSQTVVATGGTTPYSWSVISGSLPAGLSLGSSSGTISGTPTATGTSNFTVRVTDSQGTPDTDDQALSIVVGAATGNTYYVSNSGSDAWPGTEAQPWATLQYAVNMVAAGDTIIAKPGTYVGFRAPATNGTASAPITVKSQTQGAALINAKSASIWRGSMIELDSSAYWIVDGFEVDGTVQGSTFGYGVDIRNTNDITLKNCNVHNANMTGIFMAFVDNAQVTNNMSHHNGEHGIYMSNSADYGVTSRNTSYNNTWNGLQNNGDVSMGGDGMMSYWLHDRNTLYSNYNGYNFDGLEYSTIRNSLIYDIASKGFSIYGGDAAKSSNNDRLLNNTLLVTSSAYYGIIINDFGKAVTPVGHRFFNNILYHYGDANGRGSICITTSAMADFQSDYNVVGNWFGINDNESTEDLTAWRARGYDVHSIQAADTALFVDPTNKDFHLKSTSPARDTGTALDDVTEDITGMSRPQNSLYDIGCYEYVVEGMHDLNITTTSLPDCDINESYGQTLQASGGQTPYTWAVISGSLPSGFSLNPSTGMISGTGTASGTSNFTVRVTDSQGTPDTDDQALSITVTTTTLIILQDDLDGYEGTRDTWLTEDDPDTNTGMWDACHLQYPTQDRQLHKFDLSSIPSGSTINSASIAFYVYDLPSGTPTVDCYRVITYWEEMQATYNSRLTGTAWGTPGLLSGTDYVATALGSTMITGTGWVSFDITSTVQGWVSGSYTNYGVMYKLLDSGWAKTYMRNMGPPEGGWGHPKLTISYTPGGGPANLVITTTSLPGGTVGVAYSQTVQATGGQTPYAWSILGGSLPAGLSLGSSSGTISGTPTASGTSNFTVRVTDSQGTPDTDDQALSIVISAAIPDLVITTTSLPGGTVGVAYSQTVQATGGQTPYAWSILGGSLPAGLSLGSSSGTISGTPTASGTSNFTVRVTDSQGTPDTDDQALSIAVSAGIPDLIITTTSLPGGQVGTAYSQTVVATGGTTPYSWSIVSGSLPAGLSLGSSSGTISGTPSASGTSNFTVRVTDSQGTPDTDDQALSIVVAPADLVITTTTLPGGTVGSAYSQTVVATGGTTPYSWSIVSGSLPAGLSLGSSSGTISGTPSASGTSNFTVRVTDSQGTPDTDDQALSISITTSTTYEYAVSDSESSTTSTSYQTKASAAFSTGAADTWVIFAFGEYKGSSTSYSTLLRLAVDSTTEAEMTVEPNDATDYCSFATVKVASLSSGSHTIALDYRSENSGATAYIRNARVVAVKKSALLIDSAAADSTTALTTTLTNYVTANFTPASAGDYLLVCGAEVSANTSYSTQVQAKLGSTVLDECLVESKDTTDYFTFASFTVANLTASSQALTVTAAKETGSTATHNIRRARAVAIRLSGSRLDGYQSAAADTESTTTSTAFQQKVTKSWNVTSAGNWLLLTSFRNGGTSTSYSVESRVQLNDSTTMAQPLREPNDTTDYMNGASVDVRNLATGTRYVDVDYCSKNSGATARIKYAHIAAIPLDGTGGVADLEITTASVPNGQIGVAYSQTVQATGGQTPYSWSVISGSLPAGLSLGSSSGTISGTPTTSGTSNFTVRVTDSQGTPDTDDQALSIAIPADLSVTTSSLPGGTVGVAYSQSLAATGGVTPYGWSVISGSLPAGLSLSSGGAISGTPTTSGTSNFTVQVADSQTPADTATKALSITVSAGIPDLIITTTTLPNGQIGVAYSQTVQATGGVTPYSWSVISGSLPAGLSLGSSSGTISGTPTASGTSNFTVRVTDSQGTPDTDDQALSIVISAAGGETTEQYASNDSEASTTSTSYQTRVTLSFTPSSADDWVILASAEIKGASTSYTLLARMRIDGTTEAESTVMPAAATDYRMFSAMKIANLTAASHTITVDYATGNSSATAYIRNARIVALKKASLEIQSNAVEGQQSLVEYLNVCCSKIFTPASAGDYLLIWSGEVNADNTTYSTTIRPSVSYVDYGQMNVESKDTGDWFSYTGFAVANLAASSQDLQLQAGKEGGSTGTHYIRRARVAAIRLSDSRFTGYQSADAMGYTSTQTSWLQHMTKSWSVGSAGNWLLLSSYVINNSATADSESKIELDDTTVLAGQLRRPADDSDLLPCGCVEVRNLPAGTRKVDIDHRSSTTTWSWLQGAHFVALPLGAGGIPDLVITTTSVPNGQIGVAYSQTVQATGGVTPYSWSVVSGSLPAGLSLGSSSGTISGTPTASGTSNFTVRVTDSQGTPDTDDQALSIVIPADLSVTTSSLPGGTVGVAYSQTVQATGGVTPYSWSVISGSLPAGLSLGSSSGTISGTPTASGTSNFTVQVTDSQVPADTATKALSIVISSGIPDLVITTTSLSNGQVGTSYSQTVVATGGVTPYSWSVISGSLPAGLSLGSSTGTISGTPTASGTSNFTVRVTDSQGTPDTDDQALSITVIPADLVITTTTLPGGQVGTAYSQTVVATGGTTPYSWSVISGALPAGLSLGSSSGTISGTPSASGTSNFTVRVTDSQGTPDTDDQALSIEITAPSPGTYEFVANDSEASTTSTSYVTRTTLTFTPSVADDWIILAFAEIKGASTSYAALARMRIDGATEAESTVIPAAATDYRMFSAMKTATLTAASHTITVDYATANASAAAYIRYARVVALRKDQLEIQSNAVDGQQSVVEHLGIYCSKIFTPATAGDYLLIWSVEFNADNTVYSTNVRPSVNYANYGSASVELRSTGDWQSYTSFKVANLAASSQDLQLQAGKEGGSTGTHYIRRARVAAIRLSDSRFAGYQSAEAEDYTSTQTTWKEHLTKSWSVGTAGNWLLLGSFLACNTTTADDETLVQLDDTTPLANQLRRMNDDTEYMPAGCVDVRNLAAGTRRVDVDHRSSTTTWSYMSGAHFVALPLQ